MNRIILITMLIFFSCSELQAEEYNPLLGTWKQISQSSNSNIHVFRENDMERYKVKNGKIDESTRMGVSIRYKKLDKQTRGIELLNNEGKKEGAMMALFKAKKSVSFGAPGNPFLDYERVSENP